MWFDFQARFWCMLSGLHTTLTQLLKIPLKWSLSPLPLFSESEKSSWHSFSIASSISWWCWTTSSWFNSKQCPWCWKNWIFLWQVLCTSGWVESFSRQSSKFWEYMYKLWRYCNYGSLLYLLVFMSSLVSEAVPLDRVDLLPYGQFCNLFFIPWSVQKDRILVNRRFAALDILRSFRSLGYC